MSRFPFYNQYDSKDCGPTCLRIIAKYYGKNIPLHNLRVLSETTRSGSNLLKISEAAEKLHFRTLGVKTNFVQLSQEIPLPVIVHWRNKHYVVVYKVGNNEVHVSDPAHGLLKYTVQEFLNGWIKDRASVTDENGVALILEPAPEFYNIEYDEGQKRNYTHLLFYLKPYRRLFLQLAIGLLCGSILQLAFPFLTQSIVDVGIVNSDMNFVYLILAAQLFLFGGTISIEFIRNWIILNVGTRVNVALISDFFIKLMKLPIANFDVKISGDIMQRINDHQRIQNLLTVSSLNVLFSIFNVAILSVVLFVYSVYIFAIFFSFSTAYVLWTLLFFKKRKELDYKMFSQLSQDQSKIVEIIEGMQEIKLNNAEREKRWGWEAIQARKFRIEIRSLSLSQIQTAGSFTIGQVQNILISIFTAKLVIDGQITLGMMLSIAYIIGQLNSPIQQFIGFLQTLQDARISFERINEIHQMKSEDDNQTFTFEVSFSQDIHVDKVSFRYPGAINYAIENISMIIPHQKTTAIVGASGSGKTTLIKLLQKTYAPKTGTIKLGSTDLTDIAHEYWRNNCGFVLQEGFIFNDTVTGNITMGQFVDKDRLLEACEIANVTEFVKVLPQNFNTKIGTEGVNLSTGQKQRILIARAIYKNPEIIFFDEATSSLDANNEREIVSNLKRFFQHKTCIIIAHRLSTVIDADNIVVIETGKIVESGSHSELVSNKSYYYNLVKNQLKV